MSLQILGLGLPRTGTQSLADALEILGYPTIHGHAKIVTPTFHDLKFVHPSSYAPFDEDYEAAIECEYWLWLLERYKPKVILTVRDCEKWFASVSAHIDKIHARTSERNWLELEEADRLHERLFGSRWPLRMLYLHAFEAHRLAVKAACQRLKLDLLIYDLTIWPRWDSLCRFLGKPVPPETAFPWRNRLVS